MGPSQGSIGSPSPPAPKTKRRQRPGAACEECRRRKLRCDGQRPQCGVCLESGVRCEVPTQRAVRGPKKGQMKALRNRVAMLEDRLLSQEQERLMNVGPSDAASPSTAELSDSATIRTAQNALLASGSVSEAAAFIHSPADGTSVLPGPLTSSTSNIEVSDLVQAELDQLYFDRVHPSIPILQQRRYLTWSNQAGPKQSSRTCLQRAMWSLAALLSAQFQHLQDALYHETKRMLEMLSLSGPGKSSINTEQAQAWILVATYEYMRTYHQQAWMSAGRAFRLVQLMRLHEVDSPITNTIADANFVETEEKRRVFWMAYFLDHLFSMRNDWPITLNEHVICTRLPSSELGFQSGQPVLGSFLSEAITETTPQVLSAFNESLILATICGRSMFYWQQYNIRCAYGDNTLDSSVQHRWLDNILENRLRILSNHYPPPSQAYDPMLFFSNILAQATVIYFCKGMKSVTWPDDRQRELAQNYQQRALNAADKIIALTKVLRDFHLFKAHPLMPMPLLLSAEFLYTNTSSHAAFGQRLEELLDIFRQLKTVGNHKQNYMALLELSCTMASLELRQANKGLAES